MNLKSIRALYTYLIDDRMSLVYAGSFKDAVTTKAIKLSEHNIEKSEDLASLKRKSSFLMAECFQNVVRHYEPEKIANFHPAKQGFFMTRSWKHMYYIASSNVVSQDIVPELKDKLLHLNELNKDELKDIYMSTLRNQGLSEKGGAGLGLIEMARKSGHPLTFDFKNISDKHALFYLLIQMKSKESESNSEVIKLSEVEDIHQIMIDNDILLIYKGDFSEESIAPIINMLETNLQSHEIEQLENKKVFVSLVEMIQNMSKHALEEKGVKKGILVISRDKDHYQIGAGNFIELGKEESISKHLELINDASFEELRAMYKEGLLNSTIKDEEVHIGLMDVAKTSKNDLQFHFSNKIDDHPFFSLMIDF